MRVIVKNIKELKSQISFFVLLCIALILAGLLMVFLSGTKFSKPKELGYAGLSVVIPTGAQWDSQQQWRYGNNSFYLTSTLRNPDGRPLGSVRFRYWLGAKKETSEELLANKASELSGKILDRDTIEKKGLSIQWINIKIPEITYEIYYGVGKLPGNHLLEIEAQRIDTAFKVDTIFENMVQNLRLDLKPPLQAGIDVIKQMKSKGTRQLLDEFDSPSAFLIMDSQNNPLGFILEVFSEVQTTKPYEYKADVLYYLREPYRHRESALFYGNEEITEYVWKSERNTYRNKTEFQTVLNKEGIITLTRLSVPPVEKILQPSYSSIPEVFSDMLVSYILASDFDKVNVEIIESNGKITPMNIVRTEPETTRPDFEEPAYALQINFLDDSGLSQKIYFDENGKTIRELLDIPVRKRGFLSSSDSRETLTFVRSKAEHLATQFPEQSEQILQKIGQAWVD